MRNDIDLPRATFTKARVHSINVSGELRHVPLAGQTITTGFFKTPLRGRCSLTNLA
jgi:hypothetical protein